MLIAQMQEGRVTIRQVEEARLLESEKWLALYDTRYNLERAKLNLLKHTGALLGCTEVENGKEIRPPTNADERRFKNLELAGHLNCYDFHT